MATLVCFHAHPDDEAISTGGVIAKAAHDGHRVVLVLATSGEHGEVPADLVAGETLADRRRRETAASAAVLGVHRLEFLGYHDSGMTGWSQNDDPAAFVQAPLDEAANRLAQILLDEQADLLTVYDWHGNYGHPDHVQVHRVGHRAAELAGTRRVFEATMNRDHMIRMMALAKEMGMSIDGEDDFDPSAPMDDGNPFGMGEEELTHAVDVSAFIERKRESIRCHRSQITDAGFFSQMPDEAFLASFGTEWFIERGAQPGIKASSLFD